VPRWIRTSKANPCPICQKPDGCLIEPDGSAVCCARVPSPILKGAPFVGGWIHKLSDSTDKLIVRKPNRVRRTAPSDIPRLALEYSENMRNWSDLQRMLGVSRSALERLQVGWDGRNWSFPMRNESEQVTGITLRPRQGKKFSVTGSVAGVYWPEGVEAASVETLFLPEGPTDCAALLDLDCEAIGRYSCRAGLDILAGILQQARRRMLVFVADNDTAKTRPDGTTFYPGIEGARFLAKKLKPLAECTKVLMPPRHKDLRQWLISGKLNRQVIEVIMKTILPE